MSRIEYNSSVRKVVNRVLMRHRETVSLEAAQIEILSDISESLAIIADAMCVKNQHTFIIDETGNIEVVPVENNAKEDQNECN